MRAQARHQQQEEDEEDEEEEEEEEEEQEAQEEEGQRWQQQHHAGGGAAHGWHSPLAAAGGGGRGHVGTPVPPPHGARHAWQQSQQQLVPRAHPLERQPVPWAPGVELHGGAGSDGDAEVSLRRLRLRLRAGGHWQSFRGGVRAVAGRAETASGLRESAPCVLAIRLAPYRPHAGV